MEEPHAPDYSHLPTDALLVVFAALFSPVSPSSYFAQEGLPLSTFIARWHAVGRVCKTWREVRAGLRAWETLSRVGAM